MNHIRQKIHPGLRGALFYSIYWGVVGLYEPFLNVYFLRLGLTGTQIGWLSSVLPLCVMVCAPLVARLADHTHRRVWFLAAGCFGYGLALAALAFPALAPTFPVLLSIVAVYSVFRSPIGSLADSLIAAMAGRYQLDFGAMRMWGSVLFTITAIGMGSLWEITGYNVMFLVASAGLLPVAFSALLLDEAGAPPARAASVAAAHDGAASVGATHGGDAVGATHDGAATIGAMHDGDAVLVGGTPSPIGASASPTTASTTLAASASPDGTPPPIAASASLDGTPPSTAAPHPPAKNGAAAKPKLALSQVDRGLWFLLGATFLFIAALFMGGNFGSVYMAQLGGTPMMIGSVLGVSAMLEVPSMLYGNRIARRLGSTNTLLIGYGLNSLGLIGYGLVQSPWPLLAFSAVRGLGFGLVLVGNVTIINRHAPRDFISTFQGVFNAACYGLAPLIGGPVSGWVYQNLGPSALFLLSGSMTLIAGLLLLPTYKIWPRQ